MEEFPVGVLKKWFLENRRPLPWRSEATPYRVWISEVMLQQTQVAVVVPYFEKWLRLFPDISTLAQAPLEEVLKCWEGLGYYSRARNLHKAARYLDEYHGGELKPELLAQLPGIGPYTQGAILSFAFHQRAVAIDGNVLRVLSRFHAFEEPIHLSQSQKSLHSYAEKIIPEVEPWLISEALIELGATVCMKKPNCQACPLIDSCLAFRHGMQQMIPKKKSATPATNLMRAVAIIEEGECVLVKKGESGEVMADLYEFPYTSLGSECSGQLFEKIVDLKLKYMRSLPPQKQSFTRFRVQLFPHVYCADQRVKRTEGIFQWKSREALLTLPFSSGHKRILISYLASKKEIG